MLVLSRSVGQVIRIGDDIEVMVTEVRGGAVRIGIDAPSAVRIKRQELAAQAPVALALHPVAKPVVSS